MSTKVNNHTKRWQCDKKIAFIDPLNSFQFVDGIIAGLSGEYNVKKFSGKTTEEIYKAMKWSDISWFDWCELPVVCASLLPKVCKIICRLHRHESCTKIPSMVRWGKVDRLIFVSEHIKERVKSLVPFIEERVQTCVIPNGVDLDKFTFKEKEKGYNIAFVGSLTYRKNIPFLLQCFKAVVDKEPRYHLHIAGRYDKEPLLSVELKDYVKYIIKLWKLDRNITFYGPVRDINIWLEDKHFILSTSIGEGHPVAIMEAMAKGLKPVIHKFPGVEKIYPSKYLFTTPEECTSLILSPEYEPKEYRKFINDNFSFEKQLKAIQSIIEELLKKRT